MEMQNNNRNTDIPYKIQLTEITISIIFNRNNDPFVSTCRLSQELCFLINKVL